MNNKILLLILVLLLAVWGGSKLFFKPVNKSFKEELVKVDSAAVNKIIITNFQDPGSEISLEKSSDNWVVTSNGKSATATDNAVQTILSQTLNIKANRLVAKGKDKWTQYEVDEQKGTKIKLFEGDELLSSFVTGRLNFNQQQRSATSYIRLDGEEDTYAVDGFLSMTFKQGFDSFRDKRLISLNKEDVTKIRLSGSEQLEFSKIGSEWSDHNGNTIDSAAMAGYLSAITNLRGAKFDDDFTPNGSTPIYNLNIEANNQIEPLILRSWQLEDSLFILNSSMNPEGNFESDDQGIFKKAFLDLLGLNSTN